MKRDKFLLLILLVVFWPLFVSGTGVASDFPYLYPKELLDRFGLPQLWLARSAEGLGQYVVAILWNWPLDLFYGLGAKLGLSFPLLEKLLGVILYIIIGCYSINKLLQHLNVKKWAKFIGSFFYLLNTYVILLIDGGQLTIALAYAWFPMAFLLITKSVRGNLNRKLHAGLAVVLLGFFDIRFVYVLFVLIFINFTYELYFLNYRKWLNELSEWGKSGLIIAFVFAGLNAYWIIPALLVKAPVLPETYARVSQTSFLSFATLGHALLLLQPHWFKNVFGKVISLQPAFYLIPILVFFAPILKRRNKIIGFWLVVALIGVFLVKGSLEPWESFYPWLFSNIPGFSMFRDPTKFFFLVALSYSVLIGFTVDSLVGKFDWSLKIKNFRLKIIPLFLAVYLLLLVSPVWTGKMTGTFSEPNNKDEFLSASEIFENDPEFGRILWLPSRAPLGYSSPTHPSLEASRLLSLRAFAIGTVGSYEQFNFLREASFMGELFDIAAIKYIAYPYPDTRREELKEDNIDYYYSFLDQLSNLVWIESRITELPVPVLKVKDSQDHIFIADNTFLVVGSDRIYNELMQIEGFELDKNALTFAEEEPGLKEACREVSCKVLLYGKKELDLLVNYIDPERFIFPAEELDFNPDETGFWKRETADFLWWRNFLQTKYGLDYQDFDFGGGYAVAEGNKELRIESSEFGENKILLARVMNSSRGGKVEFWQEEEKIGEADTLEKDPEKVQIKLTGYGDIPDTVSEYDKTEFAWHEIGSLVNNEPLTIKTDGDVDVINSIISISEDEYKSIEGSIPEDKVIEWDNLTDEEKNELFDTNVSSTLTYERTSPTHYKVNVKGLNQPASLIFSETYDAFWKVKHPDGTIGSSNKVYSLVNGFIISKDGEYEIFFEPQKYIYPGLAVSLATILLIIFSLNYLKKRS